MIAIWILSGILFFLIFFVFAPAIVCYRSVFGRRKVLPLDDEKLYKPAIEPYKERMLADWRYLLDHDCERVTVTAKDGVTLAGDYYDKGAEKTAIMIHGYNADPYVNLVAPARWLYDYGFNVLVIYHRAHGRSGGDRSGMGLLEKDDVFVWIDSVLSRDPSQRILLYGMSMGGSALGFLADRMSCESVPCMIMDCAYISTQNQLKSDAKRMHLPTLLIPLMRQIALRDLRVDINERTTGHLCRAQKPILFIHGTADQTVLLEEGKKNYGACSSDKQLVIVEGAAHTTSFMTNEKQVTDAIIGFLDRYFTASAS